MSPTQKKIMLKEIQKSLSKKSKSISSKYFYDSKGCELFQKITQLDEYYLTRCERQILKEHTKDIFKSINEEVVDVIEIGPGDGAKAVLMAEELISANQKFNFYGLDICEQALAELLSNFSLLQKRVSPNCKIDLSPNLLVGEFHQIESLLAGESQNRKLVTFLGSSIGNMNNKSAKSFLKKTSQNLKNGDFLLVGFDLKKDEAVLTRAYNDAAGITAEFNLNLLRRLNRELDANFEVDQFFHHEIYDRKLGAMTSYLVSKKDQSVQVGNKSIRFKKGEKIHTEHSFKYDKADILSMIEDSGLQIKNEYFDRNKYFTCVLFQKGEVADSVPVLDAGLDKESNKDPILEENDLELLQWAT